MRDPDPGLVLSMVARGPCGLSNDLSHILVGAETIAEQADRDKALTDRIDAVLTPAERCVGALDDLRKLLADAKYPAHAANERRGALLGLASDKLQTMTGGRLGFAEGAFKILDADTSEARDPRTLSGESFPGRGFRTLDTESLDDALSALENPGDSTRLVAVVTHIQAVAERMPSVLDVRYDPITGSSAVWVKDKDRDSLAVGDLDPALLA